MVAGSEEYMKNSRLMLLVKRTFSPDFPSSNYRFYSSSSSSSQTSSNKLFVAGLSWSVDEKSLKDAFSTYGDVTEGKHSFTDQSRSLCGRAATHIIGIMYDKETGRSRGFGFVHFTKEDHAESAKEGMDGKAMMGRPLRISFALDRIRGGPVVVPRLSNAEGQKSEDLIESSHRRV